MRIIAGTLRGRRLIAPAGLATRPTADRVREAWFSMLGPLHGRVLDLYAGTGALGFEALSRGADHVVFVENAKAAQKAIWHNADALSLRERVMLLGGNVENAKAALHRGGQFDLILCDPPWTAIDEAERALSRLLDSSLLRPKGRLVVGHPRGRPLALREGSGLAVVKQRAWGDSAATFYDLAETPLPATNDGE